MKRLRKFLTPRVTVVLFVVAALLLGTSSVTGTQAALTYFSQTYQAQVSMQDIGVSLLENDKTVAWRNYVPNSDNEWRQVTTLGPNVGELLSWAKDIQFEIGKPYEEMLAVQNSGIINEYVRVTVYKYWVKEDGKKNTELDPSLIQLEWNKDAWKVIEDTEERTVLYYSGMLSGDPSGSGNGDVSAPFATKLTISPEILKKVSSSEIKVGNTIQTVYDYDDLRFEIKAVVDAVQDHNYTDAMHSSWGVTG